MNTRERMTAVYRNTKPDKIPVGSYTSLLPSPGTLERNLREMGIGVIDSYPVATFIGPAWRNYPGCTCEVKNTDIRVNYIWDNGKYIEKCTYDTPVGSIYQLKEKDHGAGGEHIIRYYINSIEDYKIMQYIIENSILKSNDAVIKARMKILGDDGVVLARMDRSPYQRFLIEFAGVEQFLVDLFTDTEIVEEAMEALEYRMQESFNYACEGSSEFLWQVENITADMTPPPAFKKYCLPHYQKFTKQAKQADKIYITHFDGKLKSLSEDIKISGINVIDSFSTPMMAGDMEILEAKELMGDVVILPNFPSSLSVADEKTIRDYMNDFKKKFEGKFPIMLEISEDLAEGEWSRVLPIIMDVMK